MNLLELVERLRHLRLGLDIGERVTAKDLVELEETVSNILKTIKSSKSYISIPKSDTHVFEQELVKQYGVEHGDEMLLPFQYVFL